MKKSLTTLFLLFTVLLFSQEDLLSEIDTATEKPLYASAVFNMENASGLVKIVGSYLTLSDTLDVQIISND